jgi:thiol-disulfide isomerase/thioredoxin
LVEVPENGLLGQLVNAGWAAVGPAGEVYFASAIQPEVRRFGRAGDLEWVSRWHPTEPVAEPRFVADGRSVRPEFTVLQRGLAVGADGLTYVLAAPVPGSDDRLLLAFDDAGELARSARVGAGDAIFGDAEGRVYSIPLADALSRTPAAARASFRTFELPALGGNGSVTLEDYRGRVLVLNFWASWCAPCRKEMPLLNTFAAELDPERAVVLGLNEDLRPADGLAFIEEIGGVAYANAAGEGRLRDRYHYRGLPYTVILDSELRVAKSFYGFGRTIDPIRAAVRAELAAADTGVEGGTPGG